MDNHFPLPVRQLATQKDSEIPSKTVSAVNLKTVLLNFKVSS